MLKKVSIISVLISVLFIFGCSKKAELPKLSETNIIFIVVDTLGAKHLQPYNPSLKNAPNITKMSNAGVRFANAYSTAPWTKPSISSMFTSLTPSKHKLRDIKNILSQDATTMAEILKERGFKTVGKVSHTLVTGEHGFDQGFDEFNIVPFTENVHKTVTAHKVTNEAIDWLKNNEPQSTSKPFFMFLHYFDPHYNYQHHEKFDQTSGYNGKLKAGMGIRTLRKLIPKLEKEDVDYLVGLYHEEIAYTDEQIGRLIDFINTQPFGKNTLVIFAADHGEAFLEHDHLAHTRTLYEELVHVPLIFYMPAHIKPRVIKENVSMIDILPTILSLDPNVPLPIEFEGISLKSSLDGSHTPPQNRNIFFEVDFKSSGIKAFKDGIKQGDFKLIYDKPKKHYTLFNLKTEPMELNNQQSTYPSEFKMLKPILDDFLKNQGELDFSAGRKKESTPEEIEQLKSLGYM